MSETMRAAMRRRLAVLWAIALVAALVGGPLLSDGSAFGSGEEPVTTVAPDDVTAEEAAASWAETTPDWAEYRFVFADGTTLTGSNAAGESGYTGSKNQADLGLSATVHVSCSDGFADGWGEKGAPVAGVDPSPIVSWSIDKYKGGTLAKTCSGEVSGQSKPTPPVTPTGTIAPPPPPPPVDLPAPAIDVEKFVSVAGGPWLDADAATGPEAAVGDEVRFRFAVTNIGEVVLRNLTLTDTVFDLPGDAVPAALDPGAFFTVEIGPFPAADGQHVNQATVAGTGSATEPHAYSGKKNQYTIVFADGSIFEGSSDQGDVDLGLSEPTHISCSDGFGFNDSDPSNDGWGETSAPVFGVDPYPIVSLHITRYNKDGSIKTTCGHDDPTAPTTVSDTDLAHYLGVVAAPSVIIEKSTNGSDSDDAPGAYLRTGSEVLWTYTVTNTGNVELFDIRVTDDRIGEVCTVPSLGAGNTYTCSATGTAVAGQYANVGSVVATGAGSEVEDSDPSHYFGWHASVDIEKATNGIDADTPDLAPTIPVGAPITWTYVVTNTGNVTLTTIIVTDDRIPTGDITCEDGPLAPGESLECFATGVAVSPGDAGVYRNIGSVAATPVGPGGKPLQSKPVLDSDPSHYQGASGAVTIEKATNGLDADDPSGPEILVGDAVTWTYVVTNVGGIALDDVQVTDSDPGVTPLYVSGDDGDGILDVGEVWVFEATGVAGEGQYENLGTVEGQPVTPGGVPVGDVVSDEDPSHYLGVLPVVVRIGDFVWHDFDGDGVQNDGSESPLAGVEVRLLDEAGGVLATTVTDADGVYGFEVDPGTYRLEFVALPGTVPTAADQGGDDAADSDIDGAGRVGPFTVTVDDLTFDAGYYIPASLGDFAWHDFDGDGVQNDGAGSPLQGVGVGLLNADGAQIALTSTDTDGLYLFDDLAPGTYTVRFSPLPGTVFTQANVGDDASDSDVDAATGRTGSYTLRSGDAERTVDAGFYIPASLGDRVWIDVDRDGIQDDDEPGAEDVAVALLDAAGTEIATTTTDGDGIYGFSSLQPGAYQVRFDLPVGFAFTTPDAGDDSADSDADVASGLAPATQLESGESDLTIDAGLITLGGAVDLIKLVNGEDANDAPGPFVAPGDIVTFTFLVTNIGNADLVDVTVGDSVFGTVCTLDLLPVGGSEECELRASAAAGEHRNEAIAAGTPVDDSGRPIGPPVTADDPGHYFGAVPGVDVEKATNGVDADLPEDAPTVIAGSEVTWTYVVTNTGNVTLADIVVLDNRLAADAVVCPSQTLAPGAVMTCIATGIAEAAGDGGIYRNVGTASGVPVDDEGNPLDLPAPSDSDPSHYTGIVARLSLEKATNGEDADVPTGPEVLVGDPITWTYVVTNDGSVPLTGVVVVDSDPAVTVVFVSGDDNANDILDVGEVWVFEATGVAGEGQYENVGTASAVPSDADGNPIGDVVSDEDPSHYLGVLPVVVRIGDFVWHDFDGDGVQNDGSESPLAGVEVRLLDEAGGVLATTVTDADGVYGFEVDPGTYRLEFVALPGTVPTAADQGGDDAADSDIDGAGRVGPFTVTVDDLTFDAGYYIPASLGDFVWHDVDADGIQEDGEPGISGVTVTLLDAAAEQVATTTTDDDGLYAFSDLAPGDYTVSFDRPDGYFPSPPDRGDDDALDSDADPFDDSAGVSLASGESNTTIDAGYNQQAFLGDFVWEDRNGNGIQDAGEPGIESAFVRLFDGTGTVNLATVQTGDDGSYRFGPLPAGQYIVEFEKPDGFTPTVANVGSDDAVDSDGDTNTGRTPLIDLAAGEDDPTWDAGFIVPILIGDFVWEDGNGDGIQDAGEPGVPGVQVTATGPFGDVFATTTDASGRWFLTVPPGVYEIEFGSDGRAFTVQDAGTDDAVDSDVDASGRVTVTVLSGQDVDLTIDAGLVAGARLGDFVWNDLDGDGLQSAAEPGVAGVTVNLLSGDVVVATVVTGDDGEYGFEVLPGTYVVEFVVGDDARFTTPLVGSNPEVDSDANPETGRTAPVTLAFGDADLTIDAGVVLPARIGDYVWEDGNGNGVQNGPEDGLPGIRVELLDAGMEVIAEAVTDADGRYGFDVDPGTYFVRFDNAEYTFTQQDVGDDEFDSDADEATGVTGPIVMESGDEDLTIDAGLYLPAVIGDFVWEDLDRDGLQDPGEPPVAGVVVKLRSGGQELDSTTTDADGRYQFEVVPGRYRVVFETGGFVLTLPNAGDDASDSDPDPANGRTIDFGVRSGETDFTWDAGVYRLIDLQIDKEAVPDNIAETLDFEYIVTVSNLGPSDATEVVVLDLLPARVPGSDPPYTGDFAAFPCFSDWDETAGDAQNCVGDEAFQIDTPRFGSGEPSIHPSERGNEEIAPGVVAPQSVTLNEITAPAGVDCAYDATVNGVRCDVGDLAVGESLDIVFDVTSHPLNRVRVWNRAWVYGAEFEVNLDNTDADQPCSADAGDDFGDRGTGCNYVKKNEEIAAAIDLGLVKDVSAETAAPGDSLTYTVEVTNDGPFAAAGAAFVDTLPAGVTVTAVDEGCTYDQTAATVDCVIGVLMPGESAVRTIDVVVADDAPSVLVNTATVENREDPEFAPVDDNPDNDTDDARTEVPTSVTIDLEVTKTVEPSAVVVGAPATFTVTVTNRGPDDATGVVVGDLLPAELSIVSTSGPGTFDDATGEWTIGDLAAGASASLEMVVTAAAPGAFTNVAEVIAAEETDVDSTPADGEGDDYATATLSVSAVLPQQVTTTTVGVVDTLPRTGSDTGTLAGIGAALVALGLALLAAVRRRGDATGTK